MNALVPIQTTNAEVYRASTDAAGLCRDIVMKTAMTIQGRKYVKVEGWQAIAVAHGCVASAEDVHRVSDEGMAGFSAMGVIRRMSDGAEIARAEGFLGDDEGMWAKRPVYARRAMAQTRAISRACRSAFAHVVVLIDANLSTTPAEEVPDGGFEDNPAHGAATPRQAEPAPQSATAAKVDWRTLDDEMDECRTKGELDAWNKRREREIKALPKGQFQALGAKFQGLYEKLPAAASATGDGFGLSETEVREFA